MKIRELQEYLGKFDPELDIMCYSEDEKALSEERGFVLFDILDVNVSEAKRVRLEDGTPYLKFERGPNSVAMVTLEITSDF